MPGKVIAVKVAGAAYLVGLGLWTLLSRRAEREVALGGERNLRRAFAQGIVVNVLNPKTALFFLAFLPQFVHPARGPVAVQVLVLGACWLLLGMASDGTYALLSAAIAGRAARRTCRPSGPTRANAIVPLPFAENTSNNRDARATAPSSI